MKKISNIAKRVAIASSVAAMSLLSLSANKANAAEFSWDFSLTYGNQEREAFGSFTFDDSIVTNDGGYALTSFSWNGEEKTVVQDFQEWAMLPGFGEVFLDNGQITGLGYWAADEDINWNRRSFADLEINYHGNNDVWVWSPNQETFKTPGVKSVTFSQKTPPTPVPEAGPGIAISLGLLGVGSFLKKKSQGCYRQI